MTPDQEEQFKQALTIAIDQHLSNGGTLSQAHFMDGKAYCPIACLTGTPIFDLGYAEMLTRKLGFQVSDFDMWQFVHGFDFESNRFKTENASSLGLLGQEFRKKYLPEDK